jgi:hypothetical protein
MKITLRQLRRIIQEELRFSGAGLLAEDGRATVPQSAKAIELAVFPPSDRGSTHDRGGSSARGDAFYKNWMLMLGNLKRQYNANGPEIGRAAFEKTLEYLTPSFAAHGSSHREDMPAPAGSRDDLGSAGQCMDDYDSAKASAWYDDQYSLEKLGDAFDELASLLYCNTRFAQDRRTGGGRSDGGDATLVETLNHETWFRDNLNILDEDGLELMSPEEYTAWSVS